MLLLLFGCRPDAVPAEDSGAADTQTAPSEPLSDLTVTLSESIPTVVVVSWQGEPGAVRFGLGEQERGLATAQLQEDGRHEAILVGLPGEQTGWLEVIQDGAVVAEETVTTGAVDAQIPTPDIVSGSAEGYFLVGVQGSSVYHPVIFDGQGNVVWWHIYDGDREWYTSRVWLSDDGQRLVYNAYHINPGDPDGFAGLISVRPDGTEQVLTPLINSHHDFWLHSDGTVAFPRYDQREKLGEQVIGDELVVRGPDGTESVLWSAWDALKLTEDDLTDNPEGTFWTMANNLEYAPEDDAYVVSLRNRNSLIKVTAGGELLWTLGGAESDFTMNERFAGQHGFELESGEILLFDNNSDDRDTSRLLRLSVDEQAATALTDWVHTPDPVMYSAYFGDVLEFSGGIAATWGTGSILQVIDETGAETFRVQFDPPISLGFLQWEESLVR